MLFSYAIFDPKMGKNSDFHQKICFFTTKSTKAKFEHYNYYISDQFWSTSQENALSTQEQNVCYIV